MQKPENSSSRRGILAALGLGGAAVAATQLLPSQSTETSAVEQPPRQAPKNGGGYALTEHVKRYYQTTRI